MKAVLVIDMPKSCADCQIMADKWCYGIPMEKVHDKININKRPSWCPLRPLPQKKEIDTTLVFGGYENIIQEALARGYNSCLDEITGETE